VTWTKKAVDHVYQIYVRWEWTPNFFGESQLKNGTKTSGLYGKKKFFYWIKRRCAARMPTIFRTKINVIKITLTPRAMPGISEINRQRTNEKNRIHGKGKSGDFRKST